MWRLLASIATLNILVGLCSGAKVLVIPFALRSQFILGSQAAEALKASGHEVWILGEERKRDAMNKMGVNLLPIDAAPLFAFESKMEKEMVKENKPSMLNKLSDMGAVTEGMCTNILLNNELQESIKRVGFHLVVIGTIPIIACMALIPYKYDIPFVAYMPLDMPWLAGVSAMPSVQPILMAPNPLSDRMTFSERATNFMLSIVVPNLFTWLDSDFQPRFAPEKPAISSLELQRKASMWFVINDNTCLDYPRLSSPHYKNIGGLTPRPASPLSPGELKDFLDSAKEGFILVTSGSTRAWGSIMEKRLAPIIAAAASSYKAKFVLQYRGSPPTSLPSNVKYFEWMPQNDVLGHENIRGVLGHGGANGQYEFVYHGVPIICMGFMEEQRYNCRRVTEHHYGIYLPVDQITEASVISSLDDIIYDPSYKNNISRCSRIMRDMPHAKETFAFWVNHIIQFGDAHLRSASLDMPFYQLYMLDVIALLITVLLLAGFILYTVLKWFVRCICKSSKVKRE